MVLYDILRLIRRIIPHSNIMVNIEDFIFWTMSGVIVFMLIYAENSGTLRWFVVVGIVIGAVVYAKSFGTFLVKYTSRYINIILKYILKKPLNKVKMAVGYFIRKVVLHNAKKLRKKGKIT
ncbi:MAG: spore cortex biosynthesis protein YabQ [Lachnospiraceae bacterium]|nr:spore cortex biosynthesis protein YabQ [Lachnospiraceae bacterium]